MKRVLAIILTAGAVFADTTNYLSQTWKELAWTRQPVMASSDGELIDPSGTIAEAAFFSASQSYMQVMREALADMTVAVTGQTARLNAVLANTPTNGFNVAIDIPLYWTSGAPKAYVAEESCADGTNDILYVYFSRDLSRAPHVTARYTSASATNDVPGAWLSWAGDNITTNGYRGCKRCSFERPSFARNSFVRGYPHLKFGLPGVGFDIGNGIFKVGSSVGVTTTNCFFTATGDTNLVFTLDNGFFKTTGGTSDEDSDDD